MLYEEFFLWLFQKHLVSACVCIFSFLFPNKKEKPKKMFI